MAEIATESGLHALVNNAGVTLRGPLELVDLQRVRDLFEVNVFGHLALTQALLPTGTVLFVTRMRSPSTTLPMASATDSSAAMSGRPNGSTHHVIKHHFTEPELAKIFAPFPGTLAVTTFARCRRIAIHFVSA